MSETKHVSEKTRLKRYAQHLRKEIAKRNRLLRQRQSIKELEAQLYRLDEQVRHPDSYRDRDAD